MTHIPGNEDAPGFRSMPFNATLAAEPMRLCRPFVVVCTKNKTISIFSGEKTIAAFDVIFFCQIKPTNVGNNVFKVQSFPSTIVRMACD